MNKHFLKLLSLFFLFIVLSNNIFAQASSKTRIKIIGTGGATSGIRGATSAFDFSADKLPLQYLISGINDYTATKADISWEEISTIKSQDISVDLWLDLAFRIEEIFNNDEADAIIIAHGADTMEETAYFLSLVAKYSKPVILTGAVQPFSAFGTDGSRNLIDAIDVACSPSSNGRGVQVVFNSKVFDARSVTFNNINSLDAFDSPNFGPVGRITNRNVWYYFDSKKERLGPFGNNLPVIYEQMPKVEILYLYAGAKPEHLFNPLINNYTKGVVIAGLGNGNIPASFFEPIKKASDNGVIIVRSSRCPKGSVDLDVEFDDKKYNTIVSSDLSPQKARILLMLSIALKLSNADIQKIFFEF